MKKAILPFAYWLVIFLIWSPVRLFLNLSDVYTEILLKPLLWLSPLFYFWYASIPATVKRELKTSLLRFQPILLTVFLPVIGTALYAIFMNLGKLQQSSFSLQTVLGVFGISAATAIVEEIVFRGILFNWLKTQYQEIKALLLTQVLFLCMHIPVLFQQRSNPSALLIHLLMILVMGLAYTLIYRQTRSLPASILSHTTWNTMNSLVFV